MKAEELEAYWRDLRASSVSVTSEKTSVEQMLDQVALDTLKDLRAYTNDPDFYNGSEGTHGMMAKMSAMGVHRFMKHWYEVQKKQDLGVLVEIILEGQELPASDLKGFVRALPRSIIDRILRELQGQAMGLHALLSVEVLYRNGVLREDYEVKIAMNGRVAVTFQPGEESQPLSFTLHEIFRGLSP